MDNDLNVPGALGIIFEFVGAVNAALDEGLSGREQAKKFLKYAVSDVLGITLKNNLVESVPGAVSDLLKEREAARQNKDYKKADELRGKIKELGFEVVDRDGGAEVKKL